MHNICIKSFNQADINDFADLINKYAIDTDGLQVYKAIAYTTGLDRDGEVAEQSFIEQLADKLIGKPVIKNHDWKDVDGTVGTIIKSEVINNDLFVYFYVADEEVKDKLNKGIYKGVSCGFESVSEEIDGVTHLVGCKDAYEMSLVTVPAVPKASIKIKSFTLKGVDSMVFKGFKAKKLVDKYPSLKSVEPEVLEELAGNDVELTEADIEELLNEISELKAKNTELESQLAEYKSAEEKSKSETVLLDEVGHAVDELNPTEEAKEAILEEAKEACEKGDLVIEHLPDDDHYEVKSLDKFIEKIKTKYTKLGLLGQTKSAETVEETKTKDFDFSTDKNKTVTVERKVYKLKKGFKD